MYLDEMKCQKRNDTVNDVKVLHFSVVLFSNGHSWMHY